MKAGESSPELRDRWSPLRPAVALLRRMRIGSKFSLIALLFVVPLVLSAAVFERRLQADLSRTSLQLTGLRFSQALVAFAEALQDRRVATDAVLRGDPDGTAQLHDVEQALALSLAKLGDVAEHDAGKLGMADGWAGLLSEWKVVAALPPSTSPEQNYDAHTALLLQARDLLQSALDRSHLALDQDVSVHHAVRAGFQQSQSLIESLGAMRALAISALRRQDLGEEEKRLLRSATERVRLRHEELNESLERLFESAPALREPLAEQIEGAAQAERFAGVAEKAVLNAAQITMPAAPVASLGMKATKSAQQISLAIVGHVESVLTRRHDGLIRTRMLLVAASSILVLTACYLLVALVWAVRADLRQVEQRLKDIASGTLTGRSRIAGKDEFADLLRQVDAAQEQLLGLIRDVRSSATRVDRAVEQIASENSELSGRTQRMVASLESASQSILELASSVNEGTGRAASLDEMARRSSNVAIAAGKMVDQIVARMQAISTSSKRIEEIVATVDAITFQTRLLSLNAAVEAARAGEHGRGFGVVATEVRNLAARSQQASGEIRSLVHESLNQVSAGTKLASDAHAQMLSVVQSAQQLSACIEDVTRVAHEQGAAAVRIAPLLQQVQADSGHNAERVDQLAAEANALDDMARGLHESMARFRVDAAA